MPKDPVDHWNICGCFVTKVMGADGNEIVDIVSSSGDILLRQSFPESRKQVAQLWYHILSLAAASPEARSDLPADTPALVQLLTLKARFRQMLGDSTPSLLFDTFEVSTLSQPS